MRFFEIINSFPGAKIPVRKTKDSAGYDICAYEGAIIPPFETRIINTGIKVCMPEDEYLAVYIRSNIAIKRELILINSCGIIDSDYYNNPKNEGHIMIALHNPTLEPKSIETGEPIAQGIFTKYQRVDNDCVTTKRIGGIGSTNETTSIPI